MRLTTLQGGDCVPFKTSSLLSSLPSLLIFLLLHYSLFIIPPKTLGCHDLSGSTVFVCVCVCLILYIRARTFVCVYGIIFCPCLHLYFPSYVFAVLPALLSAFLSVTHRAGSWRPSPNRQLESQNRKNERIDSLWDCFSFTDAMSRTKGQFV